jgi:hypothetical protein
VTDLIAPMALRVASRPRWEAFLLMELLPLSLLVTIQFNLHHGRSLYWYSWMLYRELFTIAWMADCIWSGRVGHASTSTSLSQMRLPSSGKVSLTLSLRPDLDMPVSPGE